MTSENKELKVAPEKFDLSLLPKGIPKTPLGMREIVEDLGADAFGRETDLDILIRPGNSEEYVPFQKYLFDSGDTSMVFVRDVEVNKFGLDHKRDVILREFAKGGIKRKEIILDQSNFSYKPK